MAKVQRAKQVGECCGGTRHDACEQFEDAVGVFEVALVAGEGGESLEGERGHRVRRRRGVVDEVLLANDQSFAVVGRGEESALVGVPMMGE